VSLPLVLEPGVLLDPEVPLDPEPLVPDDPEVPRLPELPEEEPEPCDVSEEEPDAVEESEMPEELPEELPLVLPEVERGVLLLRPWADERFPESLDPDPVSDDAVPVSEDEPEVPRLPVLLDPCDERSEPCVALSEEEPDVDPDPVADCPLDPLPLVPADCAKAPPAITSAAAAPIVPSHRPIRMRVTPQMVSLPPDKFDGRARKTSV